MTTSVWGPSWSPLPPVGVLGPMVVIIVDFDWHVADFWPIQQTQKLGRIQKHHRITNKWPLGARGPNFGCLGCFWGTIFTNFVIQHNLLICNKYNAKCLFWLFEASHFGTENQSKHHVLLRRLLDILFCYFILSLWENGRFGNPFKIQWAQNCIRNRATGAKMVPKPWPWTSLNLFLNILFRWLILVAI